MLSWLPGATEWGWTLTPSLSYVGQGMINGPRTCMLVCLWVRLWVWVCACACAAVNVVPCFPVAGVSMLLGAVLGWAILGPMARSEHWAPGDISSTVDGATGWVVWVALSVMMADSVTSLLILAVRSLLRRCRRPKRLVNPSRSIDDSLASPTTRSPAMLVVDTGVIELTVDAVLSATSAGSRDTDSSGSDGVESRSSDDDGKPLLSSSPATAAGTSLSHDRVPASALVTVGDGAVSKHGSGDGDGDDFESVPASELVRV